MLISVYAYMYPYMYIYGYMYVYTYATVFVRSLRWAGGSTAPNFLALAALPFPGFAIPLMFLDQNVPVCINGLSEIVTFLIPPAIRRPFQLIIHVIPY